MENKPEPASQKQRAWTRIIWILLAWVVIMYIFSWQAPTEGMSISYTEFKKKVSQGEVSEITLTGNQITGTFKQPVDADVGEETVAYLNFETRVPPIDDPELLNLLERNGVNISVESEERPWFTTLLVMLIPWFLIVGFFLYGSKRLQERMGGSGGGMFAFGKSKAKLYRKSAVKVSFNDVAGLVNAKKELSEITDFLKDPSRFRSLGGKLPKGVLLVGPPGTGKTLMARAVAGEADVPFFSISGSEFIEMFVGVGASRVRDMFNNAKKDAPSILFIDEIDSIGRVRGTGLGGGHDEREQTLNQILSEMDGFAPNQSVVVMAATNRPDVLDPALVRPGRFDRRVTLELPQKQARLKILQVHSRNVPLADDVDLSNVADKTVGFSGADLENLVNEAALLAARKGKKRVEAQDFDESRDKIIMGIEREDILSEEEKKIVAYHEAGHALLAKLLPGVDPLRKVTIIPRGQALGATEQIPEEDRHNLSRTYLLNRIAIILGGRVVERLVFKDITTGAGDDLKKATQLARRMVRQWGMSERLGPVTFQQGEPHPFLGRELTEQRDFSEHTAQLIDEEVQKIILDMEKKAEEVLKSNLEKVDLLANALLDQETLTNEEIDRLFESSTSQKVRQVSLYRTKHAEL